MGTSSKRRLFLKRAALAAGGIGPALAGPVSATENQNRQGPTQIDAGVCVVGGGYAGLAAALRIQQAGQSVALLEASPRVGGRVWSMTLSDGTHFDIGGAWVADAAGQPDIRQLMEELGVGVYKQYAAGRNVFVAADGRISQYDPENENPLDSLPPIPLTAKFDLAAAILTLEEMAGVVHLDTPWDEVVFPASLSQGPKTTLEADRMTINTWMNLNMSTPDAKALLGAAFTGVFGIDTGAVSLLHLLFFIKSFAGRFLNATGSGPGEAEEFRVQGGAEEMAKRIAIRLGQAIHVNSPVREITQDATGVTVSSENLSVRARRVIVAIPSSLTGFIRFDPILPPDRAQLQQRVPQGAVWKIWLAYDQAFWRAQGLTGESVSIAPGDFIPDARDAGLEAGKDRPGLMNAFVAGDKARMFNAMTRTERKAQVIRELVHRYGPQAAQLSTSVLYPAVPPQNPEPDSYFEFNWTLAEWARGDFAAAPGPGVYTGFGFGPAIRQPVGRIHWAGVDTATFPIASFSGAVQSGNRAAREVLAAG